MIKILVVFALFFNIVNSTSLENFDNSNDSSKLYETALDLIKQNKNIDKAYKLLLKSSQLENLDATYALGKLYLSNKTKYHNKIKAYNTFLNSANKNHAKSQMMIGKFLLFGEIVDKDYDKAMYYFKNASKQREYDANCYIAYMYASGKGVFPNFGRAHIFALDEYTNGNKVCVKVWKDYNLSKYPIDKGWKIGEYNKPIK
jgi:TPR repeat protein